jgi:short-subunit dehydrogenase
MHSRRAMPLLIITLGMLSGCTTLGPNEQQAITGKTFVITGASSGIGRGVAERLGQLHANVVLAARRTSLLNKVAANIRAAGGTPLIVTTDVSRFKDMQKLADAAINRFGGIDVWINDAGISALGRFEDIPIEVHSRIIDVDLKGAFYGSYLAMRQFRVQGFGTLINVSSMEGEVPHAYQTSYAASKAGVLSLGQTLNQEIRLSGNDTIHIVTIMPWATDTPIWEHSAHYSGMRPYLPTMDDPQRVVDAILGAVAHPTDKVPVGWKGEILYASHRVFPSLVERIGSDIAHKYEVESAPPMPSSSGNVFEPMMSGASVEGGFKK